MGRADAGAAVLHGLVGDRELGEVVADHLGLDLDLSMMMIDCRFQEAVNGWIVIQCGW